MRNVLLIARCSQIPENVQEYFEILINFSFKNIALKIS
jgi:hypothetical protein